MSDLGISPFFVVIDIIIIIVLIIADWKIFVKAGKPGWAIFIPIYNVLVMLEIVGKPWWWLLLLLIPVVNIVILVMVLYNLVLKFGKPGWHTVLALIFGVIYFPYLAFSSAEYQG